MHSAEPMLHNDTTHLMGRDGLEMDGPYEAWMDIRLGICTLGIWWDCGPGTIY